MDASLQDSSKRETTKMVNEHSVPMEEGPNLPTGYSTLLKRILHHEDVFRRIEGSMNAFETRLKVAEHSSNPDAQIARELFTRSQRLLALCHESPGAHFVPYALAAIDYLVTEQDQAPDFKKEGGFNDDAHVMKSVLDHFDLKRKM